ncbi:MAG TPA: diaminopimelate decarboxylase [Terriglobales bacterium]|nr:diaminopimelate decarboxylase [Terriglobales bacterium]
MPTKNRDLGRPPAFSYRNVKHKGAAGRSSGSMLHCDQVSVASLVERFGTPLYIYSASTIRERMRAFEHTFRKIPHTVCYSVKANSNLSILRLLARMGCGFDVVSGGELERVLRVSRSAARRVVFSGVGKTLDEMRAALNAEVLLFNVESESELQALAECAARVKKKARIALRVNPDVSAETHPYISTGLHQHKFGIPIADARRLYTQAAEMKSLEIAGISVHIGSQITDVKPFAATMERVADLTRALRADGHAIKYIDAGGGLGISYDNHSLPSFAEHVASYAEALLTPLKGLKVHLLLEPGRWIVGPAGALITRLLYRKTNGKKTFLVVDAAMNDLLRPSLYRAHHEIVPVRASELKGSPHETVDVVGPICETGDFFARDRELPITQEGDFLTLLDTGAYGMVLASNYNTRPRPAEVLVDGKSVKLIRKRETFTDLVRGER